MGNAEMAAARYTPGTWQGIFRSRTAVLLGPGTPPALALSLWELLGKTPEVHEVLHAVTSGFGGSLAGIPWFGIVDFRDSLRVFLRGDLDLSVELPGGPVELNGRDVTTWTERRLAAPEWYRLSIAGPSHPGPVLPLGEGVVLLQSLTVTLAELPAGTEPEPAPERVPDPEPARTQGASGEASAETVIGVVDDDSGDGAETPEPAQLEAPAPFPEQAPATELTGSYDHLWEKTVVRRIEDAAVRDQQDAELDADGGPGPAPAGTNGAAAHEPEPESGAEAAPADAPSPEPQPAAAPAGQGVLIDSVPWRTGGSAGSPSEVPPLFSPPPAGPPAGQAAPAPVAPVQAASLPAAPAAVEGDHDGQTVMKSGRPATGGPAGMAGQAALHPEPDPGAGPLVLARVCGRGHANPPTHAQCALCSSPLPADAVQVARPRLGRMRVSTGELVDLDQSLVIGRQPSVSRVHGGGMPRLVQVASPSGDISRSHVEVRLEGWHVMLCDLKATNGTVLVREGQQPRRLAQNEIAILLDGDIAELGDDISLRFEEIL